MFKIDNILSNEHENYLSILFKLDVIIPCDPEFDVFFVNITF